MEGATGEKGGTEPAFKAYLNLQTSTIREGLSNGLDGTSR